MKKIVLAAVVLAMAVCATAAWSQGPGPGGPGGPGRPGGPGMPSVLTAVMMPPPQMFERMAPELGLTDDQLTKLKSIAAKSAETLEPARKAAGDADKALHEALFAVNYDAGKVTQLAAAAQKAETAIITANINAWTQMRGVLTSDQVKMLQERMSRPMVGPRPGPGPAPAQ